MNIKLEELKTLIRFGFVGVGVSSVYILLSVGIREFAGLSIHTSTAIAMCAAFTLSYFGHKIFSFRAQGSHKLYFTRFVITVIIITIIHSLLMEITTHYYAEYYYLSVFSIVIVIPVISYILNRFLIFNR